MTQAFDLLARLPNRLSGWSLRRAGLGCVIAGAIQAGAMPPANIVPLFLITFPFLVFCLSGDISLRRAAFLGWCFGFGFIANGLYWTGVSFTSLPGAPIWPVPLAVMGLAAGLGLFSALAAFIHRLTVIVLPGLRDRPVWTIVLFAVIWSTSQWLRGHALTGFPWNLAGYTWTMSTPMLQITSVIGIYGLGLVTLVIGCLPAALAWAPRAASAALSIGAGLLLAIAIWGHDRLSDPQAMSEPARPAPILRLVQPNIAQDIKWDPARLVDHFELYRSLSVRPGWDQVSIVLWGETAVPYLLADDPIARQAIANITPPGGYVITGGRRRERVTDGPDRYWNSLQVVNTRGDIVATYDKHHLVPFGEYIPFRDWLPIPSLAGGAAEYVSGSGPVTLAPPHLRPFSPLICYEVIFPHAVTDGTGRARWLLNLTNDSWYGRTAGPHQHFEIARVRAIETGLPLVRVAGTGISGVTDSYGRIVAMAGLHEQAVLDVPLPPALPGRTRYTAWGDTVFWLMTFVGLIGVGVAGLRKPKTRHAKGFG